MWPDSWLQGSRRRRDRPRLRSIEPLTVDAVIYAGGGARQYSGTVSRRTGRRFDGGCHPHSVFWPTGAMFQESSEAEKMLAVSMEKIRTGDFDVRETWTSEYLVPS
jgi:hypothetical protein